MSLAAETHQPREESPLKVVFVTVFRVKTFAGLPHNHNTLQSEKNVNVLVGNSSLIGVITPLSRISLNPYVSFFQISVSMLPCFFLRGKNTFKCYSHWKVDVHFFLAFVKI